MKRRAPINCPNPSGETTFTQVIYPIVMPIRCECLPCSQTTYSEDVPELQNSTDSDSLR